MCRCAPGNRPYRPPDGAWRGLVAFALVLAGLSSGGCSACSKDSIAELTKISGIAEASRAKSAETWGLTETGTTFRIGDGIRTKAKSTASVEMRAGGRLKLAENTTIRFAVVKGQDNAFRLAVDTGTAQLMVGKRKLAFDTSVGRAILDEGTTIELTASGDGTVTFAVLVGSAELDTSDGTRSLAAGESLELRLTMGRAELIEEPDAAIPDAGPPDAAPPPAVLQAVVKGRRVQVQKPNTDQWEKLKPGQIEVELGSRLKIGRGSSVDVKSGDESALITGVAEVVVGTPDALVDARAGGRVRIESVTFPAVAQVPGGIITAKPRKGGSATNLAINKRNGSTDIRVGKGFVDVDNGREKNTLAIGETAVLDKNGQLTITNRAPTVADMSLPAGETAVLHDRRARTALRVVFGTKCPGNGRVEMVNRRGRSAQQKSVAEGKGSAKVWAEHGVNSYVVQCLTDGVPTKRAASGRVYVRRDAGTQRLPRKPVRSPPMDADGRGYTVSYQNLLPILTFKWSKAIPARSYKLVIRPSSGPIIETKLSKPRHTFKPGDIPEGKFTFWFEPQGSTRKSKVSRLNVTFDNATPTAYIRAPAHGARWEGSVRVAGVALKGWKVSIGGTRLRLDRQHRFDTTVASPQTEQAIAIRISHPRRGNHYYLRRRGK